MYARPRWVSVRMVVTNYKKPTSLVMTKQYTARVRILFAALCIVAVALMGRLYLVQVAHGNEFSERADQQYVRSNQELYNRGAIYFYDRAGKRVPAATLKTGYVVAINPAEIDNAESVYTSLAKHLSVSQAEFEDAAQKRSDPYEKIDTRLPRATATAIQREGVEGVTVHKQRWRYYPGGRMAGRTVGFVGYDGDERVGQYGLERSYNDLLSRRSSELYVNFFAEVFADIKETLFTDKSRRGDVVTGIEPNVQAFLERAVKRTHSEWDSKMTGGIIMNPKTGQIYAMAVSPSFNPNEYGDVEDPSRFKNPLVENVYEMGSIIKPISLAIGLDTGAVTPDTTYYDKGYVELNDARIKNYDGKGRGTVDMQTFLNQSLNTGAAYIADKVGRDQFTDRMLLFAIGEKTGIDLPNETTGLVDNLHSPRRVEHATAAFGQGIAMSPIATTRALAALANGGKVVTPHVGRRIDYEAGGSKTITPEQSNRVIATSTANTVTRMLVNVVDEALRSGDVAMENYSIAAKTGTAQISKENESGYHDNKFLHSFFGYAPAYDPRFLVFLYTVEPQGAQYAAETLTDPFMNTVQYLLNYYQVPPDR